MACDISFTEAHLAGNTLVVKGNATECDNVRVTIPGLPSEPKIVPVVEGAWKVPFTSDDVADISAFEFLRQNCEREIKILVQCVKDPNCRGPDGVLLTCSKNCPDVVIEITSIEECDSEGQRNVHFQAQISDVDGGVFEWDYGDGQNSGSEFLPQSDPTTGICLVLGQHIYQTDPADPVQITLQFRLLLSDDLECLYQKEFELEPCLPVPPDCPDVVIEIIGIEECDSEGQRNVHFQAQISDVGSGVFEWDYGDGQTSNSSFLPQSDLTTGICLVSGQHTYQTDPADPVQITLQLRLLLSDDLECPYQKEFELEPCPLAPFDCPEDPVQLRVKDSNDIDVTDEYCLQAGDYIVTVISPTDSGLTYSWSKNGTPDTSQTTSDYLLALTEDEEIHISVAISKDDCPIMSDGIDLHKCADDDHEDDDDDDDDDDDNDDDDDHNISIDLCVLFRIFALLGLGFAVLGLVLLLCPVFSWFPPQINMVVGGILAAAGAIVFIVFFVLWIVICRRNPCDWLLFGWQTTVLVGAVFTYAAFCPGCIYMGFGLPLLLAGFALSGWWVFKCRPTLCRMYIEWFVFILFVLDVVSVVEIILGSCVLVSNWIFAMIWVFALLVLKGLFYSGIRRNQCAIQF